MKNETWSPPMIPDRDHAIFSIIGDIDYDSQIEAVRMLLHNQKKISDSHQQEIEAAKSYAEHAPSSVTEHAIDEWIERLQQSVFQDAAHSMAAVGMLAPLAETVLVRSFKGIERECGNFSDDLHYRLTPYHENSWDCRQFLSGKNKRWSKNICEGTKQLSDAIGLSSYLSPDFMAIIKALITYRNKMFHHGFEWPESERTSFANYLKELPAEWFMFSQTDHKPWIFYMTDYFIEACLNAIEAWLRGVGAFFRKHRRVADG